MNRKNNESDEQCFERRLVSSKYAWGIFFVLFLIPVLIPFTVGFEKYVSSNLYIFHIFSVFSILVFVFYLYQDIYVYSDKLIVRRFRGLKINPQTVEFKRIDRVVNGNPLRVYMEEGDVVYVRWTMLSRPDVLYLKKLFIDFLE